MARYCAKCSPRGLQAAFKCAALHEANLSTLDFDRNRRRTPNCAAPNEPKERASEGRRRLLAFLATSTSPEERESTRNAEFFEMYFLGTMYPGRQAGARSNWQTIGVRENLRRTFGPLPAQPPAALTGHTTVWLWIVDPKCWISTVATTGVIFAGLAT